MRRLALVAAVVVVVAMLVAVVSWALTRDRAPETPAGGPASRSSDTAHEVALALARLSTDPESLVATAAKQELRGQAQQAVPTGSKITVSERSWAPDGVGGGTMLVTVTPSGGRPTSYVAVMVNESGSWKVLATLPLARPSPSATAPR